MEERAHGGHPKFSGLLAGTATTVHTMDIRELLHATRNQSNLCLVLLVCGWFVVGGVSVLDVLCAKC